MTFRKALSFLSQAVVLLAFATTLRAETWVFVGFDHASIPAGGTSALDIQLRENNGTAFTNGSLTINLPAGLMNDGQYGDPLQFENCTPTESPGIVITRTAGTSQIVITNVSLAAFHFCDIYVRITGSTFGSYTVTVPPGSFSSSTPPTTNINTATATLGVAAPVYVTTAADSGGGSLRDAINTVNANCGLATGISFNIPGAGPHVIQPLTQLPTLTCGINIDATTQPGSVVTDTTAETDAIVMVVLDGSKCAGCNGLTLSSGGIATISGFAIHSFAGTAVLALGGGVTVSNNFIGTDPGGLASLGNGIGIDDGSNRISAYQNLITANGTGIVLNGFNSDVAFNWIGGAKGGAASIANAKGILVRGGYGNSVHNNYIRFNTGPGLAMLGQNVHVSSNHIWGNAGPGIDLGDDGLDAAPYKVAPPVITSVVQSGGTTRIIGSLKSTPNTFSTVEFYSNAHPFAAGTTQGEDPFQSVQGYTDASGDMSFDFTVGFLVDNITAFVSGDSCGECLKVSEFSLPVAATLPVDRTIVTNTNDSGTGSLRDAINAVNEVCAPKSLAGSTMPATFSVLGTVVTFNIPASGVQRIQPVSPLPVIACDNAVIDGFTQPGTSPNTLGVGDNAVRLIEVNGGLASVSDGLAVGGAAVTIRGLIINGFANGAGVQIVTPVGGTRILGNMIGADASGNTRIKNSYGVRNSLTNSGVQIGSGSLADRNVISGNDAGIYVQNANSMLIAGNYIGVNAAGGAAQPNDRGVFVDNTANVSILGNVISGNLSEGIYVNPATGTAIRGNIIGLDAGGAAALRNGFDGISFAVATAFGTVGGPNPGEGNAIAFNGRDGVHIVSTGVSIRGNSIHSNTFQGIGLNNGGVLPPNDSCDADTGANNWQNYPVISSVVVYSDHTNVTGTFDSTAGRTFDLDFFANNSTDAASNRAGRFFLGSAPVATTLTPSCATPFSVDLPVVAAGMLITSTATDRTTGDTSGFSAAVAATIGAPAIAASPGSWDFGAQLVGTTSNPKTVTVTNTGTSTLTITGAVASAPYNIASRTCGATLAAGASCTYAVTFAPVAPGIVPGTLTVTSDASNSPSYSVALLGAGMDPPSVSISTFASRTPGQVSTVTVRLGNPATNSFGFAGVAVQLDYPAGFAHDPSVAVGTSCGATVTTVGSPTVTGIAATNGSDPPGTNCGVVSSQLFAPTTPGTYTFTIPAGGFTIASPAYSNPAPITATVTVAVAPAPGVSLSPPSLAFASQNVGTTSAAQQVTLTNSGNASLTISSVSIGSDYTVTPCSSPLAAGASCTMNVTFHPSAAGPSTSALTLTTNAAGSPHSVPLTGTGVAIAPAVSLTPSSLTFASRTVSTTSLPQTVTLANTGNGPLAIFPMAISGDFAFTSACGASLAAGGSCTIDVTFTPLVAAARSGTLSITDSAAGSPHTVPLSGTGLSGAAAVASVSPGAVDFSPQQVGSESAQEIVTVSNTGNAPLTFTSISISGEFAIVTPAGPTPPACPVTLAPGESCRIALVFRPAGLNLRQGNLAISTNGGASTIPVLGTGMIPQPPQLVAPAAVDFGSQPIGTRSPGHAVALRNTSPFVATISELGASGDFAVSDTCTTIAAGETCSPLVTFQPTALGPRSGTLTIRTLRDADPYHVALAGSGAENPVPVLELSTTRIGFGNAFIAMPVGHDVTLRNTGQAPLIVSSIVVTGDYFSDGTCVGTIAAGGSCTVHVTFLPSIPGGRSGTVEITSNAAGSPHDVNLSGTGCFVPTPSRARFGVLLCGG